VRFTLHAEGRVADCRTNRARKTAANARARARARLDRADSRTLPSSASAVRNRGWPGQWR